MKRMLILGAIFLASATFLAPVSKAETISCAAEVPAARSGHWYYRIIDGRKCWYQGKAMMPKSSLRWPDETAPDKTVADEEATPRSVSEAETAKPSTDGRNIVAPPATEPAAWPTPVVDDNSFESRWRALRAER